MMIAEDHCTRLLCLQDWKTELTSSDPDWPCWRDSLRRAFTSCMAAELGPAMTVGGDMPSPEGARSGAKALAAPWRLQLRRFSTGCSLG